MALFGNDMFGHHMVTNSHGKGQGFGKSNPNATFGGGQASFGQHGGHHQTEGHLGNHAIFGRQKSLLNDMTSSKGGDKSKPFIFSSYSYPYDYHHDGVASMFEKPLETKKKELVKQQSESAGDRPEFRRAPSFSSNPKLMRSKTINPVESSPNRPPKISRSLSISEDITIPLNTDLVLPDFSRRNSEKARRRSTSESSQLPKKTTWPDIVKRFSRRKKASKEKTRKSTASTDDSARESMGSSSSMGTTESPRSSNDLPVDEIPRCNTIDSKLSRGSIKSRSSTSSDYDREQERIILSLLNNDLPPEDVFDDSIVSSTQPLSSENGLLSSNTDSEDPAFDPLQRIEDDGDIEDEQGNTYSESPTLVLRRIKHLHAPEVDNASVKSANSGRMTPKSYFFDKSEPSTYKQSNDREPHRKHEKTNGKVIAYADPSDSETSDVYFDFPKNVNSAANPTKQRGTSEKKRREPQVVPIQTDATVSKPNIPQRASVHDIVNNFKNLQASPLKSGKDTPTEICKPEPVLKPYVEPKVFTISPPTSRPFTSIYSKPIIPGYKKELIPENQVTVQHVKPYSRSDTLERVIPKYTNSFKPEPEVKDAVGNDNLTADSSESGYGTSHIANSPKGYDNMKVLNFVNSLPNHSDMEEQNSETSHDEMVMNGSETDSINDESELYEPRSDLSNVKCASGSDTDIASINSNISDSQLEVTKLLESPTAVCERVTSEMSRHSNQSSPSVIYRKMSDASVKKSVPVSENMFTYNTRLQNNDQPYKSNGYDNTDSFKLARDPSETELLRAFESDEKTEPQKLPDAPLEADVEVVVSQPQSMMPVTESKLYRGPDNHEPPPLVKTPRALSYASSRPYSTIQESSFTQCLDAMLHLLNCLLVVCSIGVIGTGMWLLMKDFNVNHVTIILGDNLLQVIVYISIAGAGVALLAALCLCCGVKKDKHGLSFFAIVLIIVIIAFSSAAILSAIFADKLHGIEFRVNFKERLISKYGNITTTDRENEYFTTSWDSMQKLFECCGAEGEESDMSSWAVFKKFSIWYRKQPLKATIYVPESCCKKDMNLEVCQGSDHNLLGPPVYGPPVDEIYSQKNPNLNTTGCYDLFASYLAALATWVAIVMGGLAGLYFLTVMLTWVFCFKRNQDYEEYLYGSFYEIEQEDHHDYHTEHEMETKLTSTDGPTKLDYEFEHRLQNSGGKVSEHFNHSKTPPIEETSFMTRPIETMRETPNKTSNIEDQIIPHAGRPIETHRPNPYRSTEPYTSTETYRPIESYRPAESSPTETYRSNDSYKSANPYSSTESYNTTGSFKPVDSKPTESYMPNHSYRPTETYRSMEPNSYQSTNDSYKSIESPRYGNHGNREEDPPSDTDSDSDYENKTFRRNLWLSSDSPGKAVNLLSIAIEEEDSNFEDSDVEDSNVQGVLTYKG